MSPLEKMQESFFDHIGTAVAISIVGLVGWLSTQIAPIIAPAIEASLPTHVLLGILGLSVFLNLALATVIWRVISKKSELRLKYGILWDKERNPHCPVCKHGGLNYNEWGYQLGYRCNNCEKVYGLTDNDGKDVTPAVAIAAL